MNEEEKEELQELMKLVYNNHINQKGKEELNIIIKRMQKEIESRLEEIDSLYKMMSAKDDEIETLKESQFVLYGDNGQIVGVLKYTDDVIKKDKINAKIEELENTYDENNKNDYHNQFIVDCVAILEELLGE